MDASIESARPPTPAGKAPLGGGRSPAPAGGAGLVARTAARLRASTWGAVVGRVAAIATGMVGLAAIGAASTLSGNGVPVAGAAPAASGAPITTKATTAAADAPNGTPPTRAPGGSVAPPGSSSGAPVAKVTGDGTSGTVAPSAGVTADGKVVLNQATVDEFMKLPRVGPKRAQAIVELRHRLGRFRQATDLLRVRGIGRKTLRAMLPLLVVDAPVAVAQAGPDHGTR